jgi:peptide/nickel transport system ATP-binding protein/oligopeptide transport system ATP-binding protein
MAIVGESGSGKSTLAKALIRLINIDSGDIFFKNKKINDLSSKEMKIFRKDIQMIFQDPYASLNPRFKVKDILEEPLIINKIGNKLERSKKINSIIDKVGLTFEDLEKYPHQFSGGQRQRIGIARALILQPKIVICDEPVSALDVSIQAQILNLLKKLQKEFSLTLLFITHDLRVVRQISDSIYVMRSGKLMEEGKTDIIFQNPKHEYTRMLINSIPGNNKR